MADEPNVMQEALQEALQESQKEKDEDQSRESATDGKEAVVSPKAPPPEPVSPVESVSPLPQIDEHGRSYATGKRKDAMARVWIKPGGGKIQVNGRSVEVYFARPVLRMIINQPFDAVERKGQYDVYCTVKGGGLSGQGAWFLLHTILKASNNC